MDAGNQAWILHKSSHLSSPQCAFLFHLQNNPGRLPRQMCISFTCKITILNTGDVDFPRATKLISDLAWGPNFLLSNLVFFFTVSLPETDDIRTSPTFRTGAGLSPLTFASWSRYHGFCSFYSVPCYKLQVTYSSFPVKLTRLDKSYSFLFKFVFWDRISLCCPG